MITKEEQEACTKWVETKMAEFHGVPLRTFVNSSFEFPGLVYKKWQWNEMFRDCLPEDLAKRIRELILVARSYWEVWPLLSVADLGTIMQVGATKFLPEVIHEKL